MTAGTAVCAARAQVPCPIHMPLRKLPNVFSMSPVQAPPRQQEQAREEQEVTSPARQVGQRCTCHVHSRRMASTLWSRDPVGAPSLACPWLLLLKLDWLHTAAAGWLFYARWLGLLRPPGNLALLPHLELRRWMQQQPWPSCQRRPPLPPPPLSSRPSPAPTGPASPQPPQRTPCR